MGYKKDDPCLTKAYEDERLFILMTRDPSAPKVVIEWIKENIAHQPPEKLHEVLDCAIQMAMQQSHFHQRKVLKEMDKLSPRQIAIDMDSTLCYNCSPYIGGEVPDAIRVVKRLQDAGHILILYTMRVDELLTDAIKWCSDRGIKFQYVNRNEMYESGSRKVYFHACIDDKNIGIPLIRHPHESKKPIVDWLATEKILEERGYL